jgi:UDP-N-acetylglucosamine 2-epimerase (non-hydrolysing)
MVLMGTRPEAIKLAPVVLEMRRRADRFNCILISTGQHQEMMQQVLDAFGLGNDAVDVSLELMTKGQTLPGLTSRIMEAMSQLFQDLTLPDMLLVQGDTTTAFIGALAALYFKIPVGHVEAGLRTGDIYSPFPEEVNRQSIGVMATLHFASTAMAAENLFRESKRSETIFVTGNPVVDALQQYSNQKAQNSVIGDIQHAMATRCGATTPCRLVLLTAHRRENHGQPLVNIMRAMTKILERHSDVLIVYPVHLNPKVREAIQQTVPAQVFAELMSTFHGRQLETAQHTVQDGTLYERFMLKQPLDYPDLVQIMGMSSLIVTDSGGIQEEGAVLGKPILILRDTTERPEGVYAGIAKLVGTDPQHILQEMDTFLGHPGMSADILVKARALYGDGHASEKIGDLVEWYLTDRQGPPPVAPFSTGSDEKGYDLVVVLTVWKRETLEMYLQMMAKQTVLQQRPEFKTNIIVFQNSDHLDVAGIIKEWTDSHALWEAADVVVTYINSPIPTGYFGRFLAPLLSNVRGNGYFVVCDDDVLFGSKYLENMLRVVDDGYLAIRVGRFVGWDASKERHGEHMGMSMHGWRQGVQVTFEDDIKYDFGGQMWAGKIDWLRKAWHHPPPSLVTSEDFWISAVLRRFYSIGTKRPRCPAGDIQQCACSMQEANDHKAVEVGTHTGGEFAVREDAMNAIVKEYDYVPLGAGPIEKESTSYTFHEVGQGPWSLESSTFEKCLYFI